MIRILIWIVFTILIYWLNITSIISGSIIQKVGMVAGSTLLSILPLISIKWWCYLEEHTQGKKRPIINHIIAPIVAILTPLIFIDGPAYLQPDIVLQALLTTIIFFPSGNLQWFWNHRFGDLKEFPDSGQVDQKQLARIRNLALAWIFAPLPMYYLAELFYQS